MNDQLMATFASRQSLSVAEAVTLPALFAKVAAETSRPVCWLVNEATFNNAELGEYLAECARTVAATMALHYGDELRQIIKNHSGESA